MRMKFYLCSLLATAAITAPVNAAVDDADIQENDEEMIVTMVDESLLNASAQMPAPCKALNLDETQKVSLRSAHFEFAKQRNTLMAVIRNARLDVGQTLMRSTSTKEEGANSLMALKTAKNQLGQVAGDFLLKVFYDILKPEQRANGWMCMKAHSKMKNQRMLRNMCSKLPPMHRPPKN